MEEEQDYEEDYKTWKKNAPYLYDTLYTTHMTWPSMTVEWMPSKDRILTGNDYSNQRLLIGTHCSHDEVSENHLQIMTVKIPDGNSAGPQKGKDKFTLDMELNHDREVNKARYMPQSHNIIATKTVSGEIHIFDYFKHSSKPLSPNEVKPNMRLLGHQQEGYGLAWCPQKEGLLLSGSDDGYICIWDINSCPADSNKLDALHNFKGSHSNSVVNDVCWNFFDDKIFISVGDDKQIIIWDLRQLNSVQVIQEAHS